MFDKMPLSKNILTKNNKHGTNTILYKNIIALECLLQLPHTVKVFPRVKHIWLAEALNTLYCFFIVV